MVIIITIMTITIVITKFWKKICSNKKVNDEQAEWIKIEKKERRKLLKNRNGKTSN